MRKTTAKAAPVKAVKISDFMRYPTGHYGDLEKIAGSELVVLITRYGQPHVAIVPAEVAEIATHFVQASRRFGQMDFEQRAAAIAGLFAQSTAIKFKKDKNLTLSDFVKYLAGKPKPKRPKKLQGDMGFELPRQA